MHTKFQMLMKIKYESLYIKNKFYVYSEHFVINYCWWFSAWQFFSAWMRAYCILSCKSTFQSHITYLPSLFRISLHNLKNYSFLSVKNLIILPQYNCVYFTQQFWFWSANLTGLCWVHGWQPGNPGHAGNWHRRLPPP